MTAAERESSPVQRREKERRDNRTDPAPSGSTDVQPLTNFRGISLIQASETVLKSRIFVSLKAFDSEIKDSGLDYLIPHSFPRKK